jgi:hypothetical protein
MALSLATVGAKITATFVNLIIARVNRQGVTAIIPTSVAGTTVTVSATGVVSFTAATSVSINGCFTTEFDNYEIALNVTSIATAANLELRLRVAGTDLSTSTYLYGGTSNNGAGASTGSNGTTAGFYLTRNPVGAVSGAGKVIVFSPMLAAAKRIISTMATANATYVTGDTVGGTQASTSLHDGLSIINDGGFAMAGSVTVRGLSN